MDNCPTCHSSAPHLHPAMQHEGEVEICRDAFHLTVTPENTREKILAREALLFVTVGARCPHCGGLGPGLCKCIGLVVGR